jgi:glycosyltransferase involved in cell wall biosynthesis
MLISVITPSFRNSQWLKLCIASVADQHGVEAEHIVQDAGSDDGTLDWLPHDRRVRAYVEKDAGMYDAINRGVRRSTGEILAYLNCDEQYLPGALKAVHDFFAAHPEIEVVFANTVVVDTRGEFICYRKVVLPQKHHVMVCHLPTFTCATFFRRRVIEQYDLWFDSRWRDLGDADWVVRLLEQRVPMAVLPHYTSVFTDTGENMNLKPNAEREKERMFRAAPRWAQRLALGLHGLHWLRRLAHGNYCQRPFPYAIYTLDSPTKRVEHHVAHPTFLWKERFRTGVASTVRLSVTGANPNQRAS